MALAYTIWEAWFLNKVAAIEACVDACPSAPVRPEVLTEGPMTHEPWGRLMRSSRMTVSKTVMGDRPSIFLLLVAGEGMQMALDFKLSACAGERATSPGKMENC